MESATLRWAKRGLNDLALNAKRFGATGDGTTDDTAALQAWLTAAEGKVAYLPSGTYLVTDTLTVPSNVTIDAAPGATITIPDNATLAEYTTAWGSLYPVITNADHDNGNENIVIHGLTILGNGDNQPNTNGMAGVYLKNADGCQVRDCVMRDFNYGVNTGVGRSYCLLAVGCEGLQVIGGHYQRAGYECIGIRTGCKNVAVVGVYVREGKTHDLQTVEATNVTITGSTFDSIGTEANGGLTFHTGSDVTVTGCTIRCKEICLKPFDGFRRFTATGNVLHTTSSFCFATHTSKDGIACGDMVISGNILRSEGQKAGNPLIRLGVTDTDPIDNVMIANNLIISENAANSNTTHGIRIINGSTNIGIIGNTFRMAGSARAISLETVSYVRVQGNDISTGGACIRLSNVTDAIVTGNICRDGSHGVIEVDSTDYSLITANNVRDIATSGNRVVTVGANSVKSNNIGVT